jgi:hypothetical protein
VALVGFIARCICGRWSFIGVRTVTNAHRLGQLVNLHPDLFRASNPKLLNSQNPNHRRFDDRSPDADLASMADAAA